MAFGKLGRGLALAGALVTTDVAAETPSPAIQLAAMTNGQIEDCGVFLRDQREAAELRGTPMSRQDSVTLLAQCHGGQLQERIAEQRAILVVLDERLQALNLRLDDQSRIIDENGEVIAFIVSINGQWVIQRQLESDIADSEAGIAAAQAESEAIREETRRINANTERMLQEAERILQSLATS